MKENNTISISGNARIHFNSIKMNESGGYWGGGIGAPIEGLKFTCILKKGPVTKILCFNKEYTDKAKKFVSTFLEKWGINEGVEVNIANYFPSHIGLGSGCQLAMALGEGISQLFGINTNYLEIARISKRAGVSGVGLYSFAFGGLIVESGFKLGECKEGNFLNHSQNPPELVNTFPIDNSWKSIIFFPKKLTNKDLNEYDFFEKCTPVPIKESDVIASNILMGIVPSVKKNDYISFLKHFLPITILGTKKAELELNKKYIEEINLKAKKMFSFSLKRLEENNFSITRDGEVFLDKFTMENRYDSLDKIDSNELIERNKLPFLALSSLGPCFFSILSDAHHDINNIFSNLKSQLGNSWEVILTDFKNQESMLN